MGVRNLIYRYRGPIVVLCIVLVANILYVTRVFSPNPIDYYSGVAVNVSGAVVQAQPTIDPNSAYTTQTLGRASARQIISGHIPWWNSFEQVGAPMAGEMQSAALFVPFNLLLLLGNGIFWFHLALEIVAAFATYFLLRRLGCREFISAIGGGLFALNGTFAWFGAANASPVAFLPMIILGIELALGESRAAKRASWVVIAFGLSFSLYSGFPEVAFIDGLLAGVWFLVRLWQVRKTNWQGFCLRTALGLFVGLLLAAPVLIAFKEYLPYANVGGGHEGSFKSYSLPLLTLPGLFMPYVFGPIFAFNAFDKSTVLTQFWQNIGGYVTLPLVFMAIFGAFTTRGKNRLLAIVLAVWTVIVIARNYGFPGLADIINIIPGLKSAAFYRYVNPTIELAMLVLAMLGLQSIPTSSKQLKKALVVTGSIVLTLLFLLSSLAYIESQRLYLAPHHRLILTLCVFWGFITAAALFSTLWFVKKYRILIVTVILLIDAISMFVFPQISAPRTAIIDTAPIKFLQKNLGNQRFYSIASLMPNYSSYYGIAAINTNNIPASKSWTDYLHKNLNSNANPLNQFTGIDMADPKGITPTDAFLKNLSAYEYVGVKYVMVGGKKISQEQASNASLKLVFSDEYYQIYELPNTKAYFESLNGACKLDSISRVEVTARCTKDDQLIRKELFIPGWDARANGHTVTVHKNNDLFQVVSLKKGMSTIKYSYAPPHVGLAYAALSLGLLLLIGYASLLFISRFKNVTDKI